MWRDHPGQQNLPWVANVINDERLGGTAGKAEEHWSTINTDAQTHLEAAKWREKHG